MSHRDAGRRGVRLADTAARPRPATPRRSACTCAAVTAVGGGPARGGRGVPGEPPGRRRGRSPASCAGWATRSRAVADSWLRLDGVAAGPAPDGCAPNDGRPAGADPAGPAPGDAGALADLARHVAGGRRLAGRRRRRASPVPPRPRRDGWGTTPPPRRHRWAPSPRWCGRRRTRWPPAVVRLRRHAERARRPGGRSPHCGRSRTSDFARRRGAGWALVDDLQLQVMTGGPTSGRSSTSVEAGRGEPAPRHAALLEELADDAAATARRAHRLLRRGRRPGAPGDATGWSPTWPPSCPAGETWSSLAAGAHSPVELTAGTAGGDGRRGRGRRTVRRPAAFADALLARLGAGG